MRSYAEARVQRRSRYQELFHSPRSVLSHAGHCRNTNDSGSVHVAIRMHTRPQIALKGDIYYNAEQRRTGHPYDAALVHGHNSSVKSHSRTDSCRILSTDLLPVTRTVLQFRTLTRHGCLYNTLHFCDHCEFEASSSAQVDKVRSFASVGRSENVHGLRLSTA